VSERILTIGHSTHEWDEFVAILRAHGVQHLFDVRTMPRSRRNPQFNTDVMSEALCKVGIDYTHLKALGGLRKPRADSPNGGWRNESFRGYADHMDSPEFRQALQRLIETGRQQTVVAMCAEAVPWRCHRWLIADALTARGVKVEHILSEAQRKAHELTEFARIAGDRITYPPEQPDLFSAR
jgi:uncharacterized protein (DUF488 family)